MENEDYEFCGKENKILAITLICEGLYILEDDFARKMEIETFVKEGNDIINNGARYMAYKSSCLGGIMPVSVMDEKANLNNQMDNYLKKAEHILELQNYLKGNDIFGET